MCRAVAVPTDTDLPALCNRPDSLARAPLIIIRDFNMDSNSNSSERDSNVGGFGPELTWPKAEVDSGSESPRRDTNSRLQWSSENTKKLIEILEKDCRELWDVRNPFNKDRTARQARLEYLADTFGTTSEEISRKIHNLRTQFNNELRKIKRRQVAAGGGEGASAGGSGWEHFEALTFLLRAPTNDPLDIDGVNLALAEFQAEEEEEFGAAVRALNAGKENSRGRLRVAASAPPPLPPLIWPEEPVPRLRPGVNADECQIFGDFVASELRTLRSDESRKRLKRIIQKAILQIGEEEDVNIING